MPQIDKKTLLKKNPFSMLMSNGTLITGHALKKDGTRKFSATTSAGIQVNSPLIKVDNTGSVLSVLPSKRSKCLTAHDLAIAADVAAVYAGHAKATQVSMKA